MVLPLNGGTAFYLFKKTLNGLGGVQSSIVTVDVFETDKKCLVVHGLCLHCYRLAFFVPVPKTDNQLGHYSIRFTTIITSLLVNTSSLSW
jgi:hypothetical protein